MRAYKGTLKRACNSNPVALTTPRLCRKGAIVGVRGGVKSIVIVNYYSPHLALFVRSHCSLDNGTRNTNSNSNNVITITGYRVIS